MCISILELAMLIIVMVLLYYIVAMVEHHLYITYWYKDEDGVFRNHFTIKRFLKDIFVRH